MAEENQVQTDVNAETTAGNPALGDDPSMVEPDITGPVLGADDVTTTDDLDEAAYEQYKAQLQSPQDEPEAQAPEPEGGSTAAPEAVHAVAEGEGATPPESAPSTPTEPETPVQATEEEPTRGKSFRPRLDMFSDVEKEAVALYKELKVHHGIDLSFKECLERVEAKYANGGEPDGEQPLGPTVDELRGRLGDLKAQRKAALGESDLPKVHSLEDEIDALRDEIDEARERERDARGRKEAREAEQLAERQMEVDRALDESKTRALKTFPSLAQEGSPISAKWMEIYERMTAEGDPLVSSANAPEMIALMAAAELGMAPASAAATTPSPAVTELPTPVPARPAIQPAPGGARSMAPSQAGQLEALLDKAQTMDEYEAIKAKAGLA